MSDPRTAVAATLRIVAEWGLSFDDDKPARERLFDIADEVEQLERDDMCCPLCEESTCDEGCPLRTCRGEP